jgi:hypothetical protein
LAGKPSAENINSSSILSCVEVFDVFILFGVGEMMFEDFTRELFPFAVEDVVPSVPFCCEVKASDS